MGRLLVIDASVARAAGDEAATDPVSICCRNFLVAVRSICHKSVVTPDVLTEWRKHRSKFFSTWLTSMDARKKVVRIESPEIQIIREKVDKLNDEDGKIAMTKDLHLVAAAKVTDGLIISMDEKARDLFDQNCERIGAFKGLVWVNPCKPEDKALDWLQGGAPTEKNRQLGLAQEI